MVELSLVRRVQHGASGFGEGTVKVPFDIIDAAGRKNLIHLCPNVIAHIFTGDIQYVLKACLTLFPVGQVQTPIRMCPVQIGVGRDHFRFKPDTELHAQRMDAIDQGLEASVQFVFIDGPVTQRPFCVNPITKPTVIHHQHFNAQCMCTAGKVVQLVFVKIKICCLPGIDEQRAAGMAPMRRYQMGTMARCSLRLISPIPFDA